MGAVIFVVVLAVIVVIFGAIFLGEKIEQWRKKKEDEKTRRTVQPAAAVTSANPEAAPKDEPPFIPHTNPLPKFRENLKGNISNGISFNDALDRAIRDSKEEVSMDDAVDETLKMGYPMKEVAAFMAFHEYSFREILEMINKNADDFKEVLETAAPFAKGETPKDRARALLGAVDEIWALDDDDKKNLLGIFEKTLGCKEDEALDVFYEYSSDGFVETAINLGVFAPATFAALVKSFEIDLTDSTEYKALRDHDDVAFKAAATILRACNVKVSVILETENEYDTISLSDLSDVASDLKTVGFTSEEIAKGIGAADCFSNENLGAIVEAIQNNVELDDLATMLVDQEADADDLDEGMRDAQMEIRDRVKILQAYFDAVDSKGKSADKAPVESANLSTPTS